MNGSENIIFTPEQVEKLAYNQTAGTLHPFTCPNRGDGKHTEAYGDRGALVATVRGWICPFCDYTQDWAHSFMLDAKHLPIALRSSLKETASE